MKMKKLLAMLIAAVIAMATLTSCFGGGGNGDETGDVSGQINVVTREDGSGTRGAFEEILDIMDEDGSGIFDGAAVINSTSAVMETIAGDRRAIGYISLGALGDNVRAIQIDGADATPENVTNGSYTLARPFNIVIGENLGELAQDFVDFILSSQGQAIVAQEGYVPLEGAGDYSPSGLTGAITVNGSTSVHPIMEQLSEAYMDLNSGVNIELQQAGTSAGIADVIDGTADIGMASRELRGDETGVSSIVIARDGLAVIVHNNNPIIGLTSAQVREIFRGELREWDGTR